MLAWASTGMRVRLGGRGEAGLSGFLPGRGGRVGWGVSVVLCAEIEQSACGVLPQAVW